MEVWDSDRIQVEAVLPAPNELGEGTASLVRQTQASPESRCGQIDPSGERQSVCRHLESSSWIHKMAHLPSSNEVEPWDYVSAHKTDVCCELSV
jgi:hypothetical protein